MLKAYGAYANDSTNKSHLANSSKQSEDQIFSNPMLKKSPKKIPPSGVTASNQNRSNSRKAIHSNVQRSKDRLESSYNSSRGNKQSVETPKTANQKKKNSQDKKLPKPRECMIGGNSNFFK